MVLCYRGSSDILDLLLGLMKQIFYFVVLAKECRVQETRRSSPSTNSESIKPLDSSPNITRAVCKGTVYTGCLLLIKESSFLLFGNLIRLLFCYLDCCAIIKYLCFINKVNSSLIAGPPSMAPDHRKQIDNLKKFSEDFRVSILCNIVKKFK